MDAAPAYRRGRCSTGRRTPPSGLATQTRDYRIRILVFLFWYHKASLVKANHYIFSSLFLNVHADAVRPAHSLLAVMPDATMALR